MILLDTNIVSEIMRPEPSTTVVDWMDNQVPGLLFLCSFTVAEIQYGLEALPDGARREALQDAFFRFLDEGFDGRILDFDLDAARIYGRLMAHRRRLGRPLSVPDGQIASIAMARHFTLATRNVRDFEHLAIQMVNPFA